MLLKAMKLRADEMIACFVLIIIGFLFGNGLLAGIVYFDKTINSVFRIGSLMAMSIGIAVSIIIGMVNLFSLFNLQIGFGISRKSFFIYDVIVTIIWNAIMAVIFIILNIVDGIILKTIFSAYPEEDKFILSEYMVWILLAVICLAVVRELAGVIILKYGLQGTIILWAVFMIFAFVPQRFVEYADEQKTGILVDMYNSISDWFINMDMAGFGIMGVVFAAVGLFISWLMIRKQAVTS